MFPKGFNVPVNLCDSRGTERMCDSYRGVSSEMQLSHPLKCHRMEACCVAMFTIQWFRTGGDFDHICATCCFQKTQYSELKGTDCEFAGVTRLFTPGRLGTQSTECNKLDYTFFFFKNRLMISSWFLKVSFWGFTLLVKKLHYKLLTAMAVGNSYHRTSPEESEWN